MAWRAAPRDRSHGDAPPGRAREGTLRPEPRGAQRRESEQSGRGLRHPPGPALPPPRPRGSLRQSPGRARRPAPPGSGQPSPLRRSRRPAPLPATHGGLPGAPCRRRWLVGTPVPAPRPAPRDPGRAADDDRPSPVPVSLLRGRPRPDTGLGVARQRADQPWPWYLGGRAGRRMVPRARRKHCRELGGEPLVLPPRATRRWHARQGIDPEPRASRQAGRRSGELRSSPSARSAADDLPGGASPARRGRLAPSRQAGRRDSGGL